MNADELAAKIDELKCGIRSETESTAAHVDTSLIIDLANEIDELQDQLWALES